MLIIVSEIEYEKIEGLEIKPVNNKLWYFCLHCNYNNDRKYHAKMHFQRIHVNGGRASHNKRKYPEKFESSDEQNNMKENVVKKRTIDKNENTIGANAWTKKSDKRYASTTKMTEMVFEEYSVRRL